MGHPEENRRISSDAATAPGEDEGWRPIKRALRIRIYGKLKRCTEGEKTYGLCYGKGSS